MAVTKILVDGEEVQNLSTPVRYTLKGNGKHKVLYIMDTDTIKAEAFKNCDIEKITIPPTINKIKEGAFTGSKIKNVVLLGDGVKNIATDSVPEEAILTVSGEKVGSYEANFNAQAASSKTTAFISEVPVGCVLYEKSDGTLYTAEFSNEINDTPLGVCVIPKGMFDDHAHFISLENIAYDESGNVIHATDIYNHYCLWAPLMPPDDGIRWWRPGIECYSQMPYCAKLFHTGEEDEPVIYLNEEDMPDLVGTDKPSGNMHYTENVDYRFAYDLGVWDWSGKERSHFIECCQDGSSTYTLPGGVSLNNPYYRGSSYPNQTIMPCKIMPDEYWIYDRHYFAPSPYMQVSQYDEVTANPVLLKDLPPSPDLAGDRGNPFRFIGSANEFLIPNIISQCIKPTEPFVKTEDNYESDNAFKYGKQEDGVVTFFAAPYCAYEYAPGTGNTIHQWALGTPLEWICAFAKFVTIQSTISNLISKYGVEYDYLQDWNCGFYWGGLMSNEGLVFLMDGNSRRVENMTTNDLPRLRTRPFIVI